MRALAFAAALFALGTSSARADDAVVLDAVAARVDDHVVLLSDVKARAKPPYASAAMHAALDEIIEEIVVGDAAKPMHLEVSDEEMRHARDAVASQNGFTDEQLEAEIRKQGMTTARWERLVRVQLLVGKLIQLALAKEVRPPNATTDEAWLAKKHTEIVQRLRAAATIEVRL